MYCSLNLAARQNILDPLTKQVFRHSNKPTLTSTQDITPLLFGRRSTLPHLTVDEFFGPEEESSAPPIPIPRVHELPLFELLAIPFSRLFHGLSTDEFFGFQKQQKPENCSKSAWGRYLIARGILRQAEQGVLCFRMPMLAEMAHYIGISAAYLTEVLSKHFPEYNNRIVTIPKNNLSLLKERYRAYQQEALNPSPKIQTAKEFIPKISVAEFLPGTKRPNDVDDKDWALYQVYGGILAQAKKGVTTFKIPSIGNLSHAIEGVAYVYLSSIMPHIKGYSRGKVDLTPADIDIIEEKYAELATRIDPLIAKEAGRNWLRNKTRK